MYTLSANTQPISGGLSITIFATGGVPLGDRSSGMFLAKTASGNGTEKEELPIQILNNSPLTSWCTV